MRGAQAVLSALARRTALVAKSHLFAAACFSLITGALVWGVYTHLQLVSICDDGGVPHTLLTFRGDAPSILAMCGVQTAPEDAVSFSKATGGQGSINIIRAFPVQLTADHQTRIVRIATGNVGDVLTKAGVTLGADDLISVSPDQPVSKNLSVQVRRVTYQQVVRAEPITNEIKNQESPLLRVGAKVVINAGAKGETAVTVRERYIDGEKAEEQEVSRVVTKKPVTGLQLVGTAKSTPVSRLEGAGTILTSRGEPARYSKCLTGKGTAYTARSGARTASGRKASVGVVAVDPRLIPYGTRLYITSADGSFVYGYAVAGDTGGFVHNGSGVLVDLYFSTMAECQLFGARNVNVYVLE